MTKKDFRSLIGDNGLYQLDTASWRTVRPVMDKEKCIECGICLSVCPVFAIEGTPEKTYYINYDYCKGCSLCSAECPHKAITMVPENLEEEE